MSEIIHNPEIDIRDYLRMSDVLKELGQAQYLARPLTNAFPDEYPNLGEGIRYEGTYDNYHEIKIHPDDVLVYAEKFIDYKNQTSPFKIDKESVLKSISEKL